MIHALRSLAIALVTVASAAGGARPAARELAGLPDALTRVRLGIGAVGVYNRAAHPSLEVLGSGFFVDEQGHFLTANHVLEAIAQRKRLHDLCVFLPSDADRTGHLATVAARDPRHDLALLRVKGGDYVPLELGDSTKVREGQAIALTGFPFGFSLGLHPSTCAGIISSVCPIAEPVASSRLLDADTIDALRNPFNVFQLDVTAYPGHSGGPLFDPQTGKVLAMVNSAFIRKTKEKVISSGISYAMPIHLAKPMLDEARKAKPGPALTPSTQGAKP